MKIKPLGFYVLIEMVNVEKMSEGGIVLPDELINKEQSAVDVGYVRAIGPTAFAGYPGCEPMGHIDPEKGLLGFKREPYEMWGLELGQKIEYRKFEGKASAVPNHENYRYIPDSHIIGAIDDE
jgi:co-chaperonin GroES (HSP10)